MRLIVAGGRDFKNYDLLCDKVTELLLENIGADDELTIISGLARGADRLGCDLAAECGYPVEGFHAQWNKYGRSAGLRRNKLMAKRATHLIAFWDGKSRGTMHMIDYAHEQGLKVTVVMYEISDEQKEKAVWDGVRRDNLL